jgi:hypothetical protein
MAAMLRGRQGAPRPPGRPIGPAGLRGSTDRAEPDFAILSVYAIRS